MVETNTGHRHRHRSHSRSRHSDNESQVSRTSRCSRHSSSSRRSHCRHTEDRDSQCSSSSRKRKHRRKHRKVKSDSTEKMVDTKSQWQEIQQRKKNEIHVNSTVKSAHTHKTDKLVNSRASGICTNEPPPTGTAAPDQFYPDDEV